MNGQDLERFVTRLEQSLLPPGFQVQTRQREFGANGQQLAEFDIVVTGRLGSSSVKWLIECRDRLSDGAAPASWIEQLVGRRARFAFDKVMAVSTTGFASGAVEYAKQVGVDLRTVAVLQPDQMFDWLRTEGVQFCNRNIHLTYFKIMVADTETEDRIAAACTTVRCAQVESPLLQNPQTGVMVRPVDAFSIAVSRRPHLWPLPVEGTPSTRDVEIDAMYPPNNCYVLPTVLGPIAVPRILYRGTLTIQSLFVPFKQLASYASAITGQRLASSAVADLTIDRCAYTLQLNHVTIDGADLVTLALSESGKAPTA